MKIPVEWLKQYIKTEKSAKELAKSFTLLGLMLDKPISEYKDKTYSTEILDLEHRMDRSDWLAITGCARDLAAFEHTEFISPELYTLPGKTPEPNQIVNIDVKCPDMVNRFNTRVFRNIRVGDSPDWLKNRLQAYGMPSINNIVDITNYVMVELGQPLHAQDLAKLEKQEIIIRKANKGEQLTTLLGETVTLDDYCFVLTQNDKATVLGGIVGGKTTGVDSNTTDIVLDAGNYNQTVIRKASRKLKIFNETVLRDDKYLHPDLTEIAIQRATKLILDLAGGIYYENVDWYPNPREHKRFMLRMDRIAKLSGMTIIKDAVKEILVRLGYVILNEDTNFIELKVPFFRTDVEVEDDIVADVLRINNYENIPTSMINQTPPVEITPEIYKFEEKLRQTMVSIGAHEHITEPLKKTSGDPDEIILENSQSEEKGALRTSIFDTLIPVLDAYKKNKFKEIKLFEIGKTYHIQNYAETREIQYVNFSDNLINTAKTTKESLRNLLREIGINQYRVLPENGSNHIIINDNKIGFIQYNGFNLKTEELMKLAHTASRAITQLEYTQYEDISIIVPTEYKVGNILSNIFLDPSIKDVSVKTEKIGDKKNVILRILHNSENFSIIKKKIIENLNSVKDIEIRS